VTVTVDDIVRLYYERTQHYAPHIVLMRELAAAYEGRVAVPLPEMDKNEKVSVPNLIQLGLDQTAMRVSSNLPDVYYQPTKPGQTLAEKRAETTRKANLAWWDHSQMEIMLGRRARWLIGFASSPVTVEWDEALGIPCWKQRNPMCTFPAKSPNPDNITPDDCLFTYKLTTAWLNARYPAEMTRLSKGSDCRPDTAFEIVEYVDCCERVLVVMGRPREDRDRGQYGISPAEELTRIPNRCGCAGVFVPGRITLTHRQGGYDGLIGLYQQQAKLMALEVIAVTRGVFPNEWVVSRPNESANIVAQANGRQGRLGKIEGGEIVMQQLQPGYMTAQTRDYLERAMRVEGGIPAEFGGEAASNIRTGRRGQDVLSATVDFPVAEAQKVLARSMQLENKCAIAQAKAYAGGVAKSFSISYRGAKGGVTYTPDDDFQSDDNTVSWPVSGTDEQNLIIGIGQRLGVGEMSLHTARIMDPWVDDPVAENDFIMGEKLEAALLNGISQQVAAGQLGAADVAYIVQEVKTGRATLEDAVVTVHERKQAEQATSGAPGTPEAPVTPGAPEAQPGLAPPGAPPAAGTIAPQPNQQGLAQLLGALRSGARGAA
jgi:hypothetical protein